jgi:hypothetical protein
MSYNGTSPTKKIQDADFETLHSGHMMPRYSFALSKQPTFISPQKGAHMSFREQADAHHNHNHNNSNHNHNHMHLQYSQRPSKRPSTSSANNSSQNNNTNNTSHELMIATTDHRPQPQGQQSNNNSLQQMSSPGIIASLLFTHNPPAAISRDNSTRSSFSDVDNLSPTGSNHQPGRKKRNVSFDASQRDPNLEPVLPGAALSDIKSGSSRAKTMSECMAEAVSIANSKQQGESRIAIFMF